MSQQLPQKGPTSCFTPQRGTDANYADELAQIAPTEGNHGFFALEAYPKAIILF